MTGVVHLVGAGPWQPDLLTVRGLNLLQRADVVVHDYLANPAHLDVTRADAERIAVGRGATRMPQAAINQLLVDRALAGARVVRLKGGDPFVFGRGSEEAEALRDAGVPYEVVPGVTAAVAAAAFAGVPVTDRRYGSTLALCTGHRRADADADLDWAALARIDTLVIYMGVARLAHIADQLIAAGKPADTPVALVRWATRPDQQTVVARLDTCGALEAEAPTTIIIGRVVDLRARIAWFERRPLHGLRVVVTRSAAQQKAFSAELAERGAEVIALPTIEIVDRGDSPEARAAVEALGTYDRVLFTSANGVRAFMSAVERSERDARAFAGVHIGCVGPATARALHAYGLRADLVPPKFVAEAFVEALLADGVAGQRILLPRARVARDVLPDALQAAGAVVTDLPIYETVSPQVDPTAHARVAAGDADLITFTASSTVHNFRSRFADDSWARLCARSAAACIGPITAQTAREAGMRVAVTARSFTIAGLVEALCDWRREEEDT